MPIIKFLLSFVSSLTCIIVCGWSIWLILSSLDWTYINHALHNDPDYMDTTGTNLVGNPNDQGTVAVSSFVLFVGIPLTWLFLRIARQTAPSIDGETWWRIAQIASPIVAAIIIAVSLHIKSSSF